MLGGCSGLRVPIRTLRNPPKSVIPIGLLRQTLIAVSCAVRANWLFWRVCSTVEGGRTFARSWDALITKMDLPAESRTPRLAGDS